MNTIKFCCASLLVFAACFAGTASGYGFRQAVAVVCENADSFIPHEDCTKYYQCSNFEPVLQLCQPGLFFNPLIVGCDFPENVPDCIGGTRDPETGTNPPVPSTPAGTTAAPTDAPTTPDATTAAQTDAPTTPVATTAAPTDAPTTPAATTVPQPTDGPTTPAPTQPEPTTENVSTVKPDVCPPTGIVFLPYPGDCQKYFVCINGEAAILTCAEGTLFDETTAKCRKAEEVNCSQVPTTQPPTEAPTTTPKPTDSPTTPAPTFAPTTQDPIGVSCPPNGIDYIPDPTDCQKYFLCVNGNPITQSCAEGLLFDPETKQCRIADEVTCNVAPQCPPGDDGISYLPVPGTCVAYIMCIAGEEYSMECAEGTEFSPDKETCVLDEDYVCPYPRRDALSFLRRFFHY